MVPVPLKFTVPALVPLASEPLVWEIEPPLVIPRVFDAPTVNVPVVRVNVLAFVLPLNVTPVPELLMVNPTNVDVDEPPIVCVPEDPLNTTVLLVPALKDRK